MQIRFFAKWLTLLIVLSVLFMFAGCGGNNNPQESSSVQGNVAQIMTATTRLETAPTPVIAHAQGTDLSGITVVAQLDGATLDTTVTDASGSFTLDVPGGDLTLVFITDAYELTLTLTVPAASDVSLTVSLQPDDTDTPVVVDKMDVTHHPIVCTSDTMTLTSDSNYVIDGGGEACIRATGSCTIKTEFDGPVDIQLVNCQQCIRAEGRAVINLVTEGSVTCEDALEDGIHTRGGADITVQGQTIEVSAMEDGIDASGNSDVHLSPPEGMTDDQATHTDTPTPPISVTGAVGIHAQGNATVDVSGDCMVEGTAENLSQSGNASITTTCNP